MRPVCPAGRARAAGGPPAPVGSHAVDAAPQPARCPTRAVPIRRRSPPNATHHFWARLRSGRGRMRSVPKRCSGVDMPAEAVSETGPRAVRLVGGPGPCSGSPSRRWPAWSRLDRDAAVRTDEVLRFGWPVGDHAAGRLDARPVDLDRGRRARRRRHRVGPDLLDRAFHRKRKSRDARAAPAVPVQPPARAVTPSIPSVIVAVLFFFTATTRELRPGQDPEPGRQGPRGRLPVELGVQVRGRPSARTAAPVSTVGCSAARSRCWCCPPTRSSSTTCSPPTSSTRSGCRRSTSSATCSRTRTRTTRTRPSRTRSTTKGAFVGRCAELCGTYHSVMNFEVRALPDETVRAVHPAARDR